MDTSGDAAVAALGGADTEMAEPDVLQLPSYCFRLADVDTAKLEELRGFGRLRVSHAVAGAVRSGSLPITWNSGIAANASSACRDSSATARKPSTFAT